MKKPKYSIIIPTMGRIQDLKNCIDSFKKQTLKNFEIIVSDDSIEKKISKKIKEITKKYHVKYVKTRGKQGTAKTVNLGAKTAIGDFIVSTDDDCIYDKKFLEFVDTSFKKNKRIASVGGLIVGLGPKPKTKSSYLINNIITELPSMIFLLFRKKIGGLILPTGSTKAFLNKEGFAYVDWLSGGSFVMKKEIWDKVGGFDENFDATGYSTEPDIHYRVKKLGYLVYYNSKIKCLHNFSTVGHDIKKRNYLIQKHCTYFEFKNTKNPLKFMLVSFNHIWKLIFIWLCSLKSDIKKYELKGRREGYKLYLKTKN